MSGMNISFKISAIDDFSRTMKNLEGQTKEIFKSAGAIGTAFTAMGAAGAAGLGLAAKSAMDFESQLSSIKAVTGATGDQMKQISKLATEMGAKTKYSSVEAAQGIEELLKAGVSLEDVMGGGLEGALSLAVAGELELADAAEIASTALNAFKADGLSVTKAADLLAGAANASATSVGELKFGLSMASAVAAGVGMTFKDTSTALAVFANSGLRGSDAGTSLKTMLLNLSPSTKDAAAEMKRLGLLTEKGTSAFYDANGSLKPLSQIAELLKTKLSKLSDEQRQLALKTMFGTDAIRAANILYNEGASGVEKMFGEMSKVKAVDVMNERMNNTKGAIEELKGAFETASISLGNALLPTIKKATELLQKLVGWFNNLSPGMQSMIGKTAAVAAGFALVVGPILMLISFLPMIVAGFAALAGPAGLVLALLAGITFAVTTVTVAFVKAYKNLDWFRTIVQKFVGVVKALFEGDWKKAWALSKDYVEYTTTGISNFLSEKLEEWKTAFNNKLSELKTIVSNKFSELKTAATNKLTEWKTAIGDWFTEQKTNITNKLTEWQTAIVGWFTSLPGVIKAKLAEWGAAIIQWTQEQNEENKRQFDEWKTSITEWFTSIPATLRAKLDEWKTAISQKFTETKDSIVNKLGEWKTSISEWFTAMPGNIRTWLENWKTNLAQKFTETKETIKLKLEEWFATIKGWFTALPNKPEIKNAGQNMVKKMSDGNNEKKQEFMDKLGKIVVDVALGALAFAAVVLVSTGREIIKRVIDGIKQINLRETGRDIIRGLVSGMSSMIGSVIDKAREIARAAKDAVKGALDINSPIKKASAKTKQKAAALTMFLTQKNPATKSINLKAVALT